MPSAETLRQSALLHLAEIQELYPDGLLALQIFLTDKPTVELCSADLRGPNYDALDLPHDCGSCVVDDLCSDGPIC